MQSRPTSRSAPQVPYFFLSYAHTPSVNSNNAANPNRWVAKLFDDLCGHLLAHTTLKYGWHAGFMDRDIQSGDVWPAQLAKALATCRVFVPLYSPRYFSSEHCGKEWTAFTQRLAFRPEPANTLPAVIVPALWTPMRDVDQLPECAHPIQFDDEAFGSRYGREGFYGLMKTDSMRAHYQRATLALARRIIDAAERLPAAAPVEPPDYMSLKSAFHDRTARRRLQAVPGRLRLTIAAPDLRHLPAGRSPDGYGSTPQEWNPYYEDHNGPLAAHAMEMALRNRFLPEVGSLTDHARQLTEQEDPDAPRVVIVDPWATEQIELRDALRQVGELDGRPVPIVAWNLDDNQTAAAESRLRRALTETLPDKEDAPPASHVTSLQSFCRNMPKIFASASRIFFRTAPAYPPGGPPVKRPRLMETETPDDRQP